MASVGSHASKPLKAASGERASFTTSTTSSISSVLYRLLVIRAFNAYWMLTFFQPDEYFQALEPAWQAAFGDASAAWLTWVSISICLSLQLNISSIPRENMTEM